MKQQKEHNTNLSNIVIKQPNTCSNKAILKYNNKVIIK